MLKFSLPMALACAIMAWPTLSTAQDTDAGLQLARSSNCLACHQVDKKRVGPAFAVIAQRFAGQEGAAAHLVRSINHGSRGQWGPVPMPAQPQVDPGDAQLIAAWILGLPGTN